MKYLRFLLLIIVSLFILAACGNGGGGGSSDTDGSGYNNSSAIVGVWGLVKTERGGEVFEVQPGFVLTFSSDKKYTWNAPEDSDECNSKGTYSVEGSTLTINETYDDCGDVDGIITINIITINSTTLITNEDEETTTFKRI